MVSKSCSIIMWPGFSVLCSWYPIRVGRSYKLRGGESSVLCLNIGVFGWFRERGNMAQGTDAATDGPIPKAACLN